MVSGGVRRIRCAIGPHRPLFASCGGTSPQLRAPARFTTATSMPDQAGLVRRMWGICAGTSRTRRPEDLVAVERPPGPVSYAGGSGIGAQPIGSNAWAACGNRHRCSRTGGRRPAMRRKLRVVFALARRLDALAGAELERIVAIAARVTPWLWRSSWPTAAQPRRQAQHPRHPMQRLADLEPLLQGAPGCRRRRRSSATSSRLARDAPALGTAEIGRMLRARAIAAGIYNATLFSGHSLRVDPLWT